jgi:ATP-dependent helicase/nuclease subunit A
VGDPKQSIYRFRRADIAIYDAVKAGPLDAGEVRLTQNFRSGAGVLAWVNGVFDTVLVAEEGVQPANTPLVPGPGGLTDPTLSVCVVHGQPAGTSAEAIRTEEARLLATLIHRAVEEGWAVRDPDGAERAMGYGDVAVLLPRRTALDIYLDAFRRAGVPVRAEGGRSFFQRQEVRDLANLLLAIDDPLDQIALVACLRATVFGCADEEILLHVARGNRLDVRADHEGSPASVAEALDLLRDLHDLRSRVSLAHLVRTVLERTRMVEIALAGWDGPQSAANLVKLADRARAFSAAGAGGLRGFARWLVDQRAASDEAEASIAEETDDVVQVMTIHASKGLEFPVVALANLQTSPRTDVDPVPDRDRGLLHVRVLKRGTAYTTPRFSAVWEEEKRRRTAEEKRLLYVAATRARDRLIVPFACEEPANRSMLQDLAPHLPAWDPDAAGTVVDGCFVVDREALPTLPDHEPPLPADTPAAEVDAALADRDAWTAERERTLTVARAGLEVHPATAGEGDAPLPAALAGAGERPLIASTTDAPPHTKGEAMHTALEMIDLRDPRAVPETVRSVCVLAGIEHATDEVLAMVEACLASPVVARARAAVRRWTEVPYTLRVDDGYATGRIDLVFREGEDLVVVDWKSDSVGPGDLAGAVERHRAQGEAYIRALQAATGLTVREVVFVFPRAGGEASLTPGTGAQLRLPSL